MPEDRGANSWLKPSQSVGHENVATEPRDQCVLAILAATRTQVAGARAQEKPAGGIDGGNSRGPMTDDQAMTAEQAATLKRLAKAAYELDAFKSNLTRAEADRRPSSTSLLGRTSARS
jgi:hypothetical protein